MRQDYWTTPLVLLLLVGLWNPQKIKAFSIASGRSRVTSSPALLLMNDVPGSGIQQQKHSAVLLARPRSPLFSKHNSKDDNNNKQLPSLFQRIMKKNQTQWMVLRRCLRRYFVIVWTVCALWFGGSALVATASNGGGLAMAQPAHAASASVSVSVQERVLEKTSPSLDKIVQQYVKDYMFDDDVYDPVESIYREAYDDATKGTYPQAVRETVTSVIGSKEAAKEAARDGGGGGIFANFWDNFARSFGVRIASASATLQKRFGMSESAAALVLSGLIIVGGPITVLLSTMIIGGMSRRKMNRVFLKRYGHTTDATLKPEEEVVAPDDDEDEDEEDEDEDDDDDEEE